jgi:hypothetical protein
MSQSNERWTQSELNGVTQWLIHHAALRAPSCLSSRLEEEWFADSESRSSALSRMRFAVGCYWAATVILNDFPQSHVPAVSLVVAARGFIPLSDRNSGYFSLRPGTLFLIVGIHAAVFCGLITTFSHNPGLSTPATEIEVTEVLPAK